MISIEKIHKNTTINISPLIICIQWCISKKLSIYLFLYLYLSLYLSPSTTRIEMLPVTGLKGLIGLT